MEAADAQATRDVPFAIWTVPFGLGACLSHLHQPHSNVAPSKKRRPYCIGASLYLS
mgnify:CR=1 FL=1|jgi:hypothetical protein